MDASQYLFATSTHSQRFSPPHYGGQFSPLSSPGNALRVVVMSWSGISVSWSLSAGCNISRGDGADSPLVSSLWHVAHVLQAYTLHFTISVPVFLSFLNFPAFPTLHAVRSHSLHLAMKPNQNRGLSAGLHPGIPTCHRIPTSHCALLGSQVATWS